MDALSETYDGDATSESNDVDVSFRTGGDGTTIDGSGSEYGGGSGNASKKLDDEMDMEETLAQQETMYVNCTKACAYSVMILSAFGIALSVFFYTRNTEIDEFYNYFDEDATKIKEAIGNSIANSLKAMDTFAASIITIANATDQFWPFVTIPDYAISASKVRSASDGVAVFFQPIVPYELRDAWEMYSWNKQQWVNETKRIMEQDTNFYGNVTYGTQTPYIFNYTGLLPYDTVRRFVPQWQNYPCNDPAFNWDWLSGTEARSTYAAIDQHEAVLTSSYMLPDPNDPVQVAETEYWGDYFSQCIRPDEESIEPLSDLIYPVIKDRENLRVFGADYNTTEHQTVATVATSIYWREFMKNILSEGRKGAVIVLDNPCCPSFTFQIDGPNVQFLGRGDHHDRKYNYLKQSIALHELLSSIAEESKYIGAPLSANLCPYTISLFPSDDMRDLSISMNPVFLMLMVLIIFSFTSCLFILHNWMVERRQRLVMTTAVQTSAIVSSLFPSCIRKKMMQQPETPKPTNPLLRKKAPVQDEASMVFNASENSSSNDHMFPLVRGSKPLADLYPETTVCFADLVGFTAWSSSRSPCQVFTLLETIYGEFDRVARERNVFKVETIGDCYVAVTGLPRPNKHHAVSMVRFANDCLEKTSQVTIKLGSSLGPDTKDLKLRIGLNSGPTTAGVLRGEKSRFQLFGDTVNTASRMESTGMPDCIHVSLKTADLLIAAGKSSWVTPREDVVTAKGKGPMKTFWVTPKSGSSSQFSGDTTELEGDSNVRSIQITRLVEWNLDVFKGLLKKIVAHRQTSGTSGIVKPYVYNKIGQASPLSEITESIELPKFDNIALQQYDLDHLNLIPIAEKQLREYLSTLAYMYRDNPFHNFEHASHVVMSTVKLLERIESPNPIGLADVASSIGLSGNDKILLDPVTQFAVVFAALIHDADHYGLSNSQLVEQRAPIATTYQGKSVAEQNAIDIAWTLLMQPNFEDLRNVIFSTETELLHFRQIVVNCVIATNIFDKELKALRESRWEKVFNDTNESLGSSQNRFVDMNRKAAMVIEYIIQVSDVVHTMQHWTVYQKWNKRLYEEMYASFRAGTSKKDPQIDWYEGELWLFDNYIIPLAQKLKVCNEFCVSCYEFLDYAIDNRREWENKGRELVLEYAEQAKVTYEGEVFSFDENIQQNMKTPSRGGDIK